MRFPHSPGARPTRTVSRRNATQTLTLGLLRRRCATRQLRSGEYRRGSAVHAGRRSRLWPQAWPGADVGRVASERECERRGGDLGRQRRLYFIARRHPTGVCRRAAQTRLHRLRRRAWQPTEVHHSRSHHRYAVLRCASFATTRSDFKIDPQRIGVTGASAGGHLSLILGTTGDDGNPNATDLVEVRLQSRASRWLFLSADGFHELRPEGEHFAR